MVSSFNAGSARSPNSPKLAARDERGFPARRSAREEDWSKRGLPMPLAMHMLSNKRRAAWAIFAAIREWIIIGFPELSTKVGIPLPVESLFG
jgi:hypothetical protein